ncbi:uncharacterized protein LOC110395819 isoform X1 [Numida meleagris]|uniref:uncharacterized protein LOC110395819 isoform X1 n=1 Tax=Numida meleagris TaxID=8996 RepID=UPI000B3DF390|nr:uncharacterized protein LOC110395819 isoform X1 [Numida meleagris]XP_021246393.1 uncharacterized protein LOC110395819 isoform X1 [Numida meleagris]
MPHITAAAALQICALLAALLAQYYIAQWYGTDPAQRTQMTKRIIACGSSFTKSYLSLNAWADGLKLWLSKTRQGEGSKTERTKLVNIIEEEGRNWYYGEKKIKSADSEAENHSYFAASSHVHSPKPESIQFSVGQVIVHKRFGYLGVIVGWDVKAKAPEEWLQHKYPPEKQDIIHTPHYRILINNASGFGKSTAYIPEEEITLTVGLEVHHPDVKVYFCGYDGSKYILQPWLRDIYPHD